MAASLQGEPPSNDTIRLYAALKRLKTAQEALDAR
jgi:hypothetical protein